CSAARAGDRLPPPERTMATATAPSEPAPEQTDPPPAVPEVKEPASEPSPKANGTRTKMARAKATKLPPRDKAKRRRVVVMNRADGGFFYWLGKLYGFAA